MLTTLIQIGEATARRDGDTQITDHRVLAAADDQYFIERRGAHQVGRDQRIHSTGEGHHREIIPQYEGDSTHRQHRLVTPYLLKVQSVLVLQYAFERRSHRNDAFGRKMAGSAC